MYAHREYGLNVQESLKILSIYNNNIYVEPSFLLQFTWIFPSMTQMNVEKVL